MKSGWRTTEFWISLLTSVGAVGAAIAGLPISAPVAAGVAAVSSVAYAISRGMAKSKQP